MALHRGRIKLFADDTAIALLHLARSLPGVLDLFTRWAEASGLALKLAKCVTVACDVDVTRYEEFAASCPQAQGIQVTTASTYLGVVVGPTAYRSQWSAANCKVTK